jgi:hypothetical protein
VVVDIKAQRSLALLGCVECIEGCGTMIQLYSAARDLPDASGTFATYAAIEVGVRCQGCVLERLGREQGGFVKPGTYVETI